MLFSGKREFCLTTVAQKRTKFGPKSKTTCPPPWHSLSCAIWTVRLQTPWLVLAGKCYIFMVTIMAPLYTW